MLWDSPWGVGGGGQRQNCLSHYCCTPALTQISDWKTKTKLWSLQICRFDPHKSKTLLSGSAITTPVKKYTEVTTCCWQNCKTRYLVMKVNNVKVGDSDYTDAHTCLFSWRQLYESSDLSIMRHQLHRQDPGCCLVDFDCKNKREQSFDAVLYWCRVLQTLGAWWIILGNEWESQVCPDNTAVVFKSTHHLCDKGD